MISLRAAAPALVLLLSTLASAAPATEATTPWADSNFATRAREALQRHFPAAKVERIGSADEVAFSIKGPPPLSLEVSFDKPRAACRQDWASCQATVDETIHAIEETTKVSETKPEQLRVALRASSKIAKVQQHEKHAVLKPFSSDAQWILVADLPQTVRLGLPASAVGMKEDAAWARALDNLGRELTTFVTQASDDFIVLQGDYAPSALLFPDKLLAAAKAQFPNKAGHLVAAAPEENIILYTVGGTEEIAGLRRAAEGGSAGSTIPLSTRVMEWDGRAWHEAK